MENMCLMALVLLLDQDFDDSPHRLDGPPEALYTLYSEIFLHSCVLFCIFMRVSCFTACLAYGFFVYHISC